MKYIFDFDDVLFDNTKKFKKHMYKVLADYGVDEEKAKEYYLKVREQEFSLKNFIRELLKCENKDENQTEEIYEKIMAECVNFTNTELLQSIERLGKENCFIITNGEENFQRDKIEYSGIYPFFSKIFIVPKSKKEIIYDICAKYKDEKITYVDDKIKFFEDLDLAKCPNLNNILYAM